MNVFMFHFGRCGSTVLGRAISNSPGVFWHGEIFSDQVPVYEGFQELDISKKQGAGFFTLEEFLEYVVVAKIGAHASQGNKFLHYGCEVKSYHFECGFFKFSIDESLDALNNCFPEARFIFLRRRNSLRRILSAIIARQTGIYHVVNPVTAPNKVLIDLDNFEDADLNFRASILDVLRNSVIVEERYAKAIRQINGLEIFYEDHIDGGVVKALEAISKGFSLETSDVVVDLERTNPFPLSAMIENFEELRMRLHDTEFTNLTI